MALKNELKIAGVLSLILSSLLLIVPIKAQEEGVLEIAEPYLEILNLVIALTILGISITLLPKLGGDVGESWRWVTLAVIAFAVLEIYGVLKGFKIFEISGLGDLIELFFGVFLLIGIFKLKKILSIKIETRRK